MIPAIVLLLLLLAAVPLAAQTENSGPIQRIVSLYREGRFEDAELEALRVLSRPAGIAPTDLAEVHRVLAFISVAREDRETAVDQFIEGLRLNPHMRLDRVLTSPKILEAYDDARARFERMSLEQRESGARVLEIYRLRYEGGRRSLLLPGWGQLHKGHRTLGTALITAFSISGAGLIYSHVATLAADDRYHNSNDPDETPDLYRKYQNAWRMRNVFAITAGAVWIYGVLDAFIAEPAATELPDITVSSTPDGTRMIGLTFTLH